MFKHRSTNHDNPSVFFRVLQCLQDAAKAIPTKTRRPLACRFDGECGPLTVKDHFETFLEASNIEQLKTLQLTLNSSLQSTEGDGNLYSVKSCSNMFKALWKILLFGPAPYLIHPAQTLGPKSPGDLKVFSCLWSACLDTRQVVGQLTLIWNHS